MAETMAEELTARHLDVTVVSSADAAFAMVTEGTTSTSSSPT